MSNAGTVMRAWKSIIAAPQPLHLRRTAVFRIFAFIRKPNRLSTWKGAKETKLVGGYPAHVVLWRQSGHGPVLPPQNPGLPRLYALPFLAAL